MSPAFVEHVIATPVLLIPMAPGEEQNAPAATTGEFGVSMPETSGDDDNEGTEGDEKGVETGEVVGGDNGVEMTGGNDGVVEKGVVSSGKAVGIKESVVTNDGSGEVVPMFT